MGMAALMGLIVGVVVAGQVLYTSTLEHLKEYGTLKAMGATNFQVACAIVAQAVAGADSGAYHRRRTVVDRGADPSAACRHPSVVRVSPEHCYAVFVDDSRVCDGVDALRVWKVMSVEPAEVFKR